MNLTYDIKYKNRQPKETINIINNFFINKGFNIKQDLLRQESSSTWTASLSACYNEIPIASSNGKGTSKEYCLASAYAELYERFCNKIFQSTKPHLYNRILNTSFNKNNFYLSPNEKEITFEQAFDSEAGKYFLKTMQDNDNDLKELFLSLYDNHFIGIPFQSLTNNNDIKYLDPRVLIYLQNSTGMAAGNTLKEAIIQGMSEIYEHIITSRIFSPKITSMYVLSDKTLRINDTISSIIDTISEKNDLYIIDFSYDFNIPVLMSLIVNKKTHTITYNLGASPIFELALERVLTELYQGTYDFNEIKSQGQLPARGKFSPDLIDYIWPGTTITKTIFPEEKLLNIKIMDEYNKKIFISGTHTEEEIYNQILNINKLNNFQVYFYDCSLDKDMIAIKLFETTTPFFQSDPTFAERVPNKATYIAQAIATYHLLETFITTGLLDKKQLNKTLAINDIVLSKDIFRFYIDKLYGMDNWFLIGSGRSNCIIMYELIKHLIKTPIECKYENLLEFFSSTAPKIYDLIISYTILARYIQEINNYSSEELTQIFNFLKLNINTDDLENINDGFYWIEKICFGDLLLLREGTYNNYINIMADLSWSN